MLFRPVFLFLCIALFYGCTSSRWVVVDEQAADANSTETILSERTIINPVKNPVPNQPTLVFEINQIVEKEIGQQVVLERSIQQYRPKWGYWIAGLSAAAFTAVAANSNMFNASLSDPAVVAFNISALVLAGFTVTQMKPVGEPIYTGEQRLSRSSGLQQVTDTLSVNDDVLELPVALDVTYSDSLIFRANRMQFLNGEATLNLGALLFDSGARIDENESLDVFAEYADQQFQFSYQVDELLSPYIEITEPVAVLRNAPANSELNIVAEVGEGSTFASVGDEEDEWFRVRFGGSDLFVSKNVANVIWLTEVTADEIDVFEFANVEFGSIDVESSVPILKPNHPRDKALILSNSFLEQPEIQRYISRDHRLFRFYMNAAYQMGESQIADIQIDSTNSWQEQIREFSHTDSTGVLYVYLSGKAYVNGDELLMQSSATGAGQPVPVGDFFDFFAGMNPQKLIVLADVDYSALHPENQNGNFQRINTNVQQQTAARLLRAVPNSVIIFANKPEQTSSLYAGRGSENKQHHIFMYYWADAIKKRGRTMNDIIRHLENNVDYTSRRLHDAPQEIQAFGNFTINPTETD